MDDTIVEWAKQNHEQMYNMLDTTEFLTRHDSFKSISKHPNPTYDHTTSLPTSLQIPPTPPSINETRPMQYYERSNLAYDYTASIPPNIHRSNLAYDYTVSIPPSIKSPLSVLALKKVLTLYTIREEVRVMCTWKKLE